MLQTTLQTQLWFVHEKSWRPFDTISQNTVCHFKVAVRSVVEKSYLSVCVKILIRLITFTNTTWRKKVLKYLIFNILTKSTAKSNLHKFRCMYLLYIRWISASYQIWSRYWLLFTLADSVFLFAVANKTIKFSWKCATLALMQDVICKVNGN